MTPGLPDPRPTGFGVLSWLWWPVLFAGWGLAGAVLGAEALLGSRSAPSVPDSPPTRPRTRPGRCRPFLALLAALAGLPALATCAGPAPTVPPTGHFLALAAAPPPPPLVGKVARCHDGDSCTLVGMKTEVRLFGMDAPEEAFPGRWVRQPGADEARDALLALIGAGTLTCSPRGESYGRVVAVCTLGPGGPDLGRAMVLAGLAWSYGGAYCAEQRDAQARRVGLWSDPTHPPTPPWTWRGRKTPRGTCR